MPSRWFTRSFEQHLTSVTPSLRLFPVWLMLGPRQVGKSALLKRCGGERQYIDLDDLATRTRANADPALFARELRPPLIIDEIQYAPELLSPVKQIADAEGEPGSVWLTGSQSFQVMRGVRETLAGRVAILNLLGLSDAARARLETPQNTAATVQSSAQALRLRRVRMGESLSARGPAKGAGVYFPMQ